MGLKSKKILGIAITTDSKKTILEYIEKYLLQTQNSKLKAQNKRVKPFVIVTPNPEQIVLAQEDKHFAQILNQADVALPDGVGLLWASRKVHWSQFTVHSCGIRERIPGVEFMEDLVGLASKRGYPIGLIGGKEGVAVEALECLQARYPGLKGWAEEPGEMYNDYNRYKSYKIYKKIRTTGTRIVFVGLGAPKQEYLIERIVHSLQCTEGKKKKNGNSVHYSLCTVHSLVLMSVGGSFDMISGRTPRAPHAIGAVGLEWLWRLTLEPWRFIRQIGLLRFLWLVVRERLG